MISATEAGGALRAAFAYDRSLAEDPLRLASALLDLLPGEEGIVSLIAQTNSLGIARLVNEGRFVDAASLLIDTAGLRPEVANLVIAAWSESTFS